MTVKISKIFRICNELVWKQKFNTVTSLLPCKNIDSDDIFEFVVRSFSILRISNVHI